MVAAAPVAIANGTSSDIGDSLLTAHSGGAATTGANMVVGGDAANATAPDAASTGNATVAAGPNAINATSTDTVPQDGNLSASAGADDGADAAANGASASSTEDTEPTAASAIDADAASPAPEPSLITETQGALSNGTGTSEVTNTTTNSALGGVSDAKPAEAASGDGGVANTNLTASGVSPDEAGTEDVAGSAVTMAPSVNPAPVSGNVTTVNAAAAALINAAAMAGAAAGAVTGAITGATAHSLTKSGAVNGSFGGTLSSPL
ncbi:hypothetical protein C8R46DRAFT_1036345 [Mycena filopes]|nr:hypothetical protein C8R46DRAFT_1036345 [Mycena filopes]